MIADRRAQEFIYPCFWKRQPQMPKAKLITKRKTSSSQPTVRRQIKSAKQASRAAQAVPPKYSEEYTEYLERYEMYGKGRPRLSPVEFDRYDDELLDLLALDMERGLDDDQTIRLQELEYLLLESEP
jgi:hypothetical protein